MRIGDVLSSADAVDLGARSGLISAPEPMTIQAVLTVQIGGSASALDDLLRQAA
jgi:hypothetical protein